MKPLLKSREVAALLGVSEPTLSRWRTAHEGPPHVNLNGIPRYRSEDVEGFVNDRIQNR
ncbi:helix-turn-helix domain-containing protein [Microbacterium sp. LMC-P-041]|uniref:helix-turn-helix transcriptional regulator n=1 Tax=Microbacterium sp. LMC-P-041 TaxID=3040293 RepID=UPI0025534FA7|nr:helix-turn-helix domain-containing protein [Microbacterium sp. LMC-P-041]